MRRETAQRLGLRTTSDLAAAINAGMDITLGCNAEFYGRKDGLMPMQDAYGRKFPRRTIARMDSGLIYQALRDGQVDAGLVFSTDGRIPAFDFVLLEDDRTYHIPQVMTPVATKEVLAAHPELEALQGHLGPDLRQPRAAACRRTGSWHRSWRSHPRCVRRQAAGRSMRWTLCRRCCWCSIQRRVCRASDLRPGSARLPDSGSSSKSSARAGT